MLGSMNGNRRVVAVFRHHPIQLIGSALGAAGLTLLAIAGALTIHAALAALTIPAIGWLIWRVLRWYAKTYSITQDGRLVCRERLYRLSDNIVTLFGQVRPHQSLFGRLLNYGDVDILQFEQTIRLRCIGNFREFVENLESAMAFPPGSPAAQVRHPSP